MTLAQVFRHSLVIEDGKFSRVLPLDPRKTVYSLGRDGTNDIVFQDHFVSRCHAILLQQQDVGALSQVPPSPDPGLLSPPREYFYRIVDGDGQGNSSTNGLLVNGQRCRQWDLQHGDVVCLGSQTAKATYHVIAVTPFLEPEILNPSELKSELGFVPDSEIMPSANFLLNRQPSYTYTHDSGEILASYSPEDIHRLASFAELSPYPIMELDLQGQIAYLNPAARLKFPQIEADILRHPALAGLLHQEYSERGNLVKREIKVKDKVWEQYAHYLPESYCIRSYFFDITDLNFQASRDLLTRLFNRRYFNEQLAIALSSAQRYEHPLALMFLDLDNFKNINTTLGHAAGDCLLQSFAERLNACVRAGDIAARWGGDEFVLLLPRIQDANDTVKLANRILDKLKQPFELAGEIFHIKSSIGIAIYPEDGLDGEILVKNADTSLSWAKDEGGNCYRFYSSTMTAKASLLLREEKLLHQAITQGQFSLHYQPQMRLPTGEITGIEALLRCSHPELSQIPVGELIALAEKTKLIDSLSEWVLTTACQQNKMWQDAGLKPIPIAVNFSSCQFQAQGLLGLIDRVLEQTKLESQWLAVEITETSILKPTKTTHQSLEALRRRGISLCLDDFGTGYSSLSYLHKFPFDTLKIDRSLIAALSDNPQDTAVVAAVIALGRSFNLRVVAEGVETAEQGELLQRLDCQEIQGYWFSPPLPAAAATRFLAEHSNLKSPGSRLAL